MPTDEMGRRLSIAILELRIGPQASHWSMGHLPTIGEAFETQGWRFEIVDLDGHCVDKILAFRVPSGHWRVAVR